MNLYERIQTWLGSQGEAGDRVSEYLSFLNQDLLAGDPSAEDFMQQLSADQVLSWLDDEQLAPDVLALLTPLSGYIRDLGEVKWWYVVEVEGFLESTCHGPFVSEEEVVRVAQGIYEQQEPTRDGLFWQTIGHDGTPDMGEFVMVDDGERPGRIVNLRRPNPGDGAPITRQEQVAPATE